MILLTKNEYFGKQMNIDEAYNFCKRITLQHYENFPVGSFLIPKSKRKYFYSIYSFSRIADDIADENFIETQEDKILSLARMDELVNLIDTDAEIKNPIFLALRDTNRNNRIPAEPYKKLLKAFKADVNFIQPNSWQDNLNYCDNSANPIGELVLRLFDNYDENIKPYSDAICTGLQLINFWQDLSRDLKNGRNYIPVEVFAKFEINNNSELFDANSEKINECLKECYEFTENFYKFGKNIVKFIKNFRLKVELIITYEGGLKILNQSKKMELEILKERPKLRKSDFIFIFLKSLLKI